MILPPVTESMFSALLIKTWEKTAAAETLNFEFPIDVIVRVVYWWRLINVVCHKSQHDKALPRKKVKHILCLLQCFVKVRSDV